MFIPSLFSNCICLLTSSYSIYLYTCIIITNNFIVKLILVISLDAQSMVYGSKLHVSIFLILQIKHHREVLLHPFDIFCLACLVRALVLRWMVGTLVLGCYCKPVAVVHIV